MSITFFTDGSELRFAIHADGSATVRHMHADYFEMNPGHVEALRVHLNARAANRPGIPESPATPVAVTAAPLREPQAGDVWLDPNGREWTFDATTGLTHDVDDVRRTHRWALRADGALNRYTALDLATGGWAFVRRGAEQGEGR